MRSATTKLCEADQVTEEKHKSNAVGPTARERMAEGKAIRERVPRGSHAKWSAAANRPDPIELLKQTDEGRVPELLPIRYGRMAQSPFAFLRGAAAIMAGDLAKTPVTGIRVQACGDCHAANFGGFGSPERRLVFDINDFDETLPAPWEWDVKRLAASFVLGCREARMREKHCAGVARTAVSSYRTKMNEYAQMRALAVWYSHLDAEILIEEAKTEEAREYWEEAANKAKSQTADHIFPRITESKNGQRRIVDAPPLVYHPKQMKVIDEHVRKMFERYMRTLPEDKRVILQRYRIVDIARKVVGVGSVGTRCAAALLMAGENDPLFLQFKEARASVLEPFAGKSGYANHGERVVTGQRMLQSASDVFLGWTSDDDGRNYYFRQLRDMKMKIDLEEMTKTEWIEYAGICGWALARAHARTGDPARIAGYLGKSERFDDAIEKFAIAYAEQTEQDHVALEKAIRAGKIKARMDVPA